MANAEHLQKLLGAGDGEGLDLTGHAFETPLNLEDRKLPRCVFADARFHSVSFARTTLEGCDFRAADLSSANLRHTDLRGADLRGANLIGADLTGANVEGAKIRRTDLEDIRPGNYGGLRRSQIQEMEVEDGYGELRRSYSGFWAAVHFSSVVLWLIPIFWIVARSFVLSHVSREIPGFKLIHISLGEQVLGYWKAGILTPLPGAAGGTWHYPWNVPFALSWAFILLYNVARLALVLRVKVLEHLESVTGVYPFVEVKGSLALLYRIARTLFYFNLVLVSWHFLRFLSAAFPVLL